MDEEAKIIIDRMNRNLDTRNSYLTFCFSSFVPLLGVILTDKVDDIFWLYLLPFFIIIPYSARIVYSRMLHAKMEAYLSVFFPNSFGYINLLPQELSGIGGKIIKILCNYELVFIGCVNAFLFVQGYKKDKTILQMGDYAILLLPIIFVVITIVILSLGVNYDALWRQYQSQYFKLKQYSHMYEGTSLIVQSKYRKNYKAKFKYNKRYYYIVNRETDK